MPAVCSALIPTSGFLLDVERKRVKAGVDLVTVAEVDHGMAAEERIAGRRNAGAPLELVQHVELGRRAFEHLGMPQEAPPGGRARSTTAGRR